MKTIIRLSLAALLAAWAALAAPARAEAEPPFEPWVFGHWVWFDESTSASVRELAADYRARGIPVGGVIIDSPWETAYNTFAFDPARYPDLAALIAELHAQDIRVILWCTSMVNQEDPEYALARERSYLAPGLEERTWWKGIGGLLNYENPEAVAWWHHRMDAAIDLGLDGWKVDGTDPVALFKGWGYRERYRVNYYTDFYRYTRERSGRRTVIMARPLEQVNHKTLGLPDWVNPLGLGLWLRFAPPNLHFNWVGDQDPTFAGMRIALGNVFRSAQAGYLIVGSDVGGYRGGGPSKEVLIRWAQWGAFSPLFENGGIGEHRPWMFDDETLEIYRRYALLREKFRPWLADQAVLCWREKRSLITPLREGSRQYLLGDDLLIAPIVQTGGKRTVAFPKGSDWVSLDDPAEVHRGGTRLRRTFGLAEFPAYARRGSEIERQLSAR